MKDRSSRWNYLTLGDVCKTGAGGTPLKSVKDYYDGGDVPWLLSGEVSQGEIFQSTNFITKKGLENSAAKIFPKNTVLVAMYGATAGQVGILRIEAATNQAVCGILPDNKFTPKFLYYVMLNKKDELIATATGNAQPNVSQIKIKSLEIPFPSVEEQKRIVAILDDAFARIDTAIANTEKNLANARELFERTVVEVLFGAPDEQGWRSASVESLAYPRKGAIRTGPFGSQLLHSEFVESGIAVLGIDNAVDNEFKWGKNRFVSNEKYKELKRYTVHPGDVLITIMGTCGRCAIVPNDIPLAINTKHLCCITLDPCKCIPDFLHAYFLYHPVAREFLAARAKGAIMAGLNMGIIKELPVRLPSLSKQSEIVRGINSLRSKRDSMRSVYNRKLVLLKELKQSLLQKAFSGELTSDFNPDALEL